MSADKTITALRKEGRIAEAYTQGYELLESNQNDDYLKNAIGWVLYEKIKAIVSEAKRKPKSTGQLSRELRKFLREYAKLGLSRPDLLFSLLLSQSIQFPDKPTFLPKFMMWAGLDAFRPEDLIVQAGEDGKVYESLLEKTARTIGKIARNISAQDFPDIREIQSFSISLIDLAISETSLQRAELLRYSKAVLLNQIGESLLAQDILIPIVRSKQNDFWTWEALADAVKPNDAERAITLYVKACLTCHDEGFSVGVLDSLGAITAQQHKLDIAKWAAHRASRIRQQRGWSVSVTLGQLIEAPWYKEESIQPISQEALHQIVKDAELFIQADLPQYNANYIDSFTTKRGKQIVKFGAVINGEPQELTMPMRSVQADLKFIAGERARQPYRE